MEFEPWDKKEIQQAKKYKDIPKQAKKYVQFIEKAIGVNVLLMTTGPRRDQTITRT
jgi:adenylosuccinate synthase